MSSRRDLNRSTDRDRRPRERDLFAGLFDLRLGDRDDRRLPPLERDLERRFRDADSASLGNSYFR